MALTALHPQASPARSRGWMWLDIPRHHVVDGEILKEQLARIWRGLERKHHGASTYVPEVPHSRRSGLSNQGYLDLGCRQRSSGNQAAGGLGFDYGERWA